MLEFERTIQARKQRPDLIMIFTEGTKTEPNYFKKFRISPVKLRIIGKGRNTIDLVKSISLDVKNAKADYANENNIKARDVKCVVWCVFDKDDFPNHNFDNAVVMAKKKGYFVAYSNESYELWYYLHFYYHTTGCTRDWYCDRLKDSDMLGDYHKNADDMYDKLKDRQNQAIKFAKKLHGTYPQNTTYTMKNPCTAVYKLVEYLNSFIV